MLLLFFTKLPKQRLFMNTSTSTTMLRSVGLINYLFLLMILLSLAACDTGRSYTLEELKNNPYNQLELAVNPAPDLHAYQDLLDQLAEKDQAALLALLESKNLELHEASFALYYLANSFSKADNLEEALALHMVAANQYLNPQSMLKLAEWYFYKEKDYGKAYEYLYQSLETKLEITENNRSHPLSTAGKDKMQYLVQELDRLHNAGAFDKMPIREQLKAALPDLLAQYRKMYGLNSMPVE